MQISDRDRRPVEQVFQEELQKSVLAALSREQLFQKIVFQGGTALRLFYGNPRFSEDIDLVLKERKTRVNLSEHISSIQGFTEDTFTFLDKVDLETQKDNAELQRLVLRANSNVLPKPTRLHLELACVPSYLNRPRILNFAPLLPAIQVEEEEEILADKLTALLCRDYLKGRDLWDIYYLDVERGNEISWKLVNRKLEDYQFKGDLVEKGEEKISDLDEKGLKTLEAELKRFLPNPQYNQYRDLFGDIISHLINILKTTDLSRLGESDDNENG